MGMKKYKTVASIREVMEDRLASENLTLAACLADFKLIKERIHVIEGLLETTDANGEEGGENV